MATAMDVSQSPVSAGTSAGPSTNVAQQASTSDTTAPTSTTGFNSRVTKRKIENIFHSLDESLLNTPLEQSQQQQQSASASAARPAKKARSAFSGSIYSTLAKYGIRSSKDKNASSKGTPTTTSNNENDKEGFIAKAAPHLSSILQRAASKRRRPPVPTVIPPVPGSSASTGTSDYSPSSLPSFLARLATFKLTTYSAKPNAVDAVAAARCGWVNDGKDRLVCGVCAGSWVVKGREGMTKEAAASLLVKQVAHLVEMHKEGCPWKVRQCDPSIYCVPLKAPAALAKEVKAEAIKLTPVMEGIEVRHPLTSTQVQNLMSTVNSVQLVAPPLPDEEEDVEIRRRQSSEQQVQETSNQDGEISETATLTSLFGWSLVPPTATSVSRPSSPSVTRATSLAPPSVPVTPRRTSGRFASLRSRDGTPSPSGPSQSRPSISHLASSSINMFVGMHQQKDTSLVQCVLCQRRVGLWAFKTPLSEAQNGLGSTTAPSTPRRSTQKRQFDVLKEHRSYCPYVAKSTTLPGPPRASISSIHSIASPPPPPLPTSPTFNFTFGLRNAPTYPAASAPQLNDINKVEGWRAALTIVLRTGLGRRQRQRSMRMSTASTIGGGGASSNATSTVGAESADAMEVDDIQAMVEDVKARGGRDLLKYVKGLFS